MSDQIDRRTLSAGLAASFMAAKAQEAQGRDLLNQVVNATPDQPLASAGVIARHANGAVALKAATGQAFGPAGPQPFGFEQPFRVASISKLVTTSVFLNFADTSRLDLDRDISELVGFELRHPHHRGVAITPRMLLSHTSGLRNGASYPVPLGHRLSEAFLPEGRHFDQGAWFGPQDHRPGDWFAYADVNFALIAQILERQSGDRFDLHMRRALFQPLGLDVGYNWSGVSQIARRRAAAAVRQDNAVWKTQVDDTVPVTPGLRFCGPSMRRAWTHLTTGWGKMALCSHHTAACAPLSATWMRSPGSLAPAVD